MLCFLLFLWLDHCYLLLLLACRTNQWDFVLSCHCMANLHLCIFVCLRTDRFDWRGQRVSVGLAPADREDVHGLDIHDALWQRLRHTWRWADSGGKAGVRELSHIHKLLFFFLYPIFTLGHSRSPWHLILTARTHSHRNVCTFQSEPQQASSDLCDLSHTHLSRSVRVHCLQPHVLGKVSALPCLNAHTRGEEREGLFYIQSRDLTWGNLKPGSDYKTFKLI